MIQFINKYHSDIETLFPGRFWRMKTSESVCDLMIYLKIEFCLENEKHANISEWRPIENFFVTIQNEMGQNQTENVSQ